MLFEKIMEVVIDNGEADDKVEIVAGSIMASNLSKVSIPVQRCVKSHR